MALLTNSQRRELWSEYQSEISRIRGALNLTKLDLRAAVDAIDQWVEDNAVSFNQAVPQPARGALTARQKVQLFMAIVRKRFEVS